MGVSLEPRLGGHFAERWEDGGQVIASVTGISQDSHLALTGSFHLGLAIGVAAFDLHEVAGGTLLRFTFRAFGVIEQAKIDGMGSGWNELVGRRLKALVETGERLGTDRADQANVRAIRDRGTQRPQARKRRKGS